MEFFIEKLSFTALIGLVDGTAKEVSFEQLDLHARIMCTLIALGLLSMMGWLCLKFGRKDSLSLMRTPGRPSTLGWAGALVIFSWSLVNGIAGYFSEHQPLSQATLKGTLFLQFIVLVVCLAAAQRSFDNGIIRGLGLSSRRWFVDSVRGVVGFLAIYPICSLLGYWSQQFLGPEGTHLHPLLEYLQTVNGIGELVLPFIIAVVMAPIAEEVMYRGLLQTAIKNITSSPWWAVILSSVFFAFIHLSISREPFKIMGFDSFMPLFVLAVVLGYNYQRTGRLWASIVIHMLFNTVNMVCSLAQNAEQTL